MAVAFISISTFAGCMSDSEWRDLSNGMNNMYDNLRYEEPAYIPYNGPTRDSCGTPSNANYIVMC